MGRAARGRARRTGSRRSASARATRCGSRWRYALYGNDIDETTNPLEAGLGWVGQAGQGRLRRRDAHREGRGRASRGELVGLEMDDRGGGAPRLSRCSKDGARRRRRDVRHLGPSVERSIAMAYVATRARRRRHRGRRRDPRPGQPARVVQTPVLSASKVKPKGGAMANVSGGSHATRASTSGPSRTGDRSAWASPPTPRSSSATWCSSSCRRSGASSTAKQAFGVVESVKAVSDLFAPISGEVVEVNGELGQKPGAREPGSLRQGLDDRDRRRPTPRSSDQLLDRRRSTRSSCPRTRPLHALPARTRRRTSAAMLDDHRRRAPSRICSTRIPAKARAVARRCAAAGAGRVGPDRATCAAWPRRNADADT